MEKSIVNLLNLLASNSEIKVLQEEFDNQIRTLRFHEAFRNNSLKVRAESNFHQSYFLIKSLGYKGELNELRHILLSDKHTNNMYYDLFFRFYKANNFISDLMPDLQRTSSTKRKTNLSIKYLLPKLHSTISISNNPGIPRNFNNPLSFHIQPVPYSEDILYRLNLINFLFSSSTNAHICTAILFAELLLASPFIDSNYELAVILSRLYLCKTGVDPTGCMIFNSDFSPINNVFRKFLQNYSSGKIEDISNWTVFFLKTMNQNFVFLKLIADSVLAKTIPDWN